jgi:hypothetical protein
MPTLVYLSTSEADYVIKSAASLGFLLAGWPLWPHHTDLCSMAADLVAAREASMRGSGAKQNTNGTVVPELFAKWIGLE